MNHKELYQKVSELCESRLDEGYYLSVVFSMKNTLADLYTVVIKPIHGRLIEITHPNPDVLLKLIANAIN